HAGSAVAALKSTRSEERFLNRVKFWTGGQAFDAEDLAAVSVRNGSHAGRDGFAIEQDGAGAALSLATAVFGAGKMKLLAQDIEQRAIWISGDGARFAVHFQVEGLFHGYAKPTNPGSVRLITLRVAECKEKSPQKEELRAYESASRNSEVGRPLRRAPPSILHLSLN